VIHACRVRTNESESPQHSPMIRLRENSGSSPKSLPE
jgi:hypothetical protein